MLLVGDIFSLTSKGNCFDDLFQPLACFQPDRLTARVLGQGG